MNTIRRKRTIYHVENGAIISDRNAVLYDSDSLEGLSPEALTRLAQLHTLDPYLCWEGDRENGIKGAWDRLIEDGLMEATK